MNLLIGILLVLVLILLIVIVFLFSRLHVQLREDLDDSLDQSQSLLRKELLTSVQNSFSTFGQMMMESQKSGLVQSENRFHSFETSNEQQLEAIRQTMERRLNQIQADNSDKLDRMRETVDEKLGKTLEEKMTRSFQAVSENLEKVYRGLGEMQTLDSGVGDLKKVLSNVKTRGIIGEVQLGAILQETLSPEQYETNVITKEGSSDRVEFAVRMPSDDGGTVYLPIDAKFPGDLYTLLQNAYDSGSREKVLSAANALCARLRAEAKDIRDKYVDPPNTTEFAILFLPFEGLYAEAVNRGMIEDLQHSFKVNLAGPSTMAALLNALQMGFQTFAIQKRSGEVWRVLGAVKTEFLRFESTLENSQKRLSQASEELDKLVGVRTRNIVRRLNRIEQMDLGAAEQVLSEPLSWPEEGLSPDGQQDLLPSDPQVQDPPEL
jgi:DNA recombination protein RmuC